MEINLDAIYAWTACHDGQQLRHCYDFSSSLHLLCLDATQAYYRHLCLPRSFDAVTWRALQEALGDYSAATITTNRLEESYLVTLYQRLQAAIGWPATLDIGEWSAAATHCGAEKFGNAVVDAMRDLDDGKIASPAPPRIARYCALLDVIQERSGYLWDEARCGFRDGHPASESHRLGECLPGPATQFGRAGRHRPMAEHGLARKAAYRQGKGPPRPAARCARAGRLLPPAYGHGSL